MREYYKQPRGHRRVKDADGWFHTGDAGFLDADGHLKIIDRAKDVGKLADGTLFAPKYIENKLKFFPYIKEAVVLRRRPRHGDAPSSTSTSRRCGNWAERRNIAYAGYTDLAGTRRGRTS